MINTEKLLNLVERGKPVELRISDYEYYLTVEHLEGTPFFKMSSRYIPGPGPDGNTEDCEHDFVTTIDELESFSEVLAAYVDILKTKLG